MALVKGFAPAQRKTLRLQPTRVICRYAVDELPGGGKLLQLDTHGSDEREIPGKVSQTLQLNEQAALVLWEILGREFGFKAAPR